MDLPLTVAVLLLLLLCGCDGQVGPLPHQVPTWPVTYAMNASTIIMPCNETGWVAPDTTTGWGLISFDWSNAKEHWAKAKPMTCAELMIAQANLTKSSSPSTRVFVYRNSIKALPWFTDVREKLSDAAYSAWFMPFNCTATIVAGDTARLVVPAPLSTGASCSFVSGQDYDRGSSGPLPNVAAASAADCCAKCTAFSGCWAAAYVDSQKQCYFKMQNQTQHPDSDSAAVGCWPPGHTPPPNPTGLCHVPLCDTNYAPPLCSGLYHDQEQTPGFPSGDGTCTAPACDTGAVPVGEYLFDPRAANMSVGGQTLLQWYVDEYLFGLSGAGSPLIDGFFFVSAGGRG